MESQQTPVNAFLEQISQHETPTMNQPLQRVSIETEPSGTKPIGAFDYDPTEVAEFAKD